MKLSSGLRISFCSNTDTGSSFMRRSIFRHCFPEIQIQQMPEIDGKKNKLQIHGIKKISVSARKFVELPVILFSDDSEEIQFQTEIYIVDRLPIDILLGNNFFRPNDINILISLLINGLPALQM
jgi:hypothetical protein